jgi:two-component system NarL family sensor kinase
MFEEGFTIEWSYQIEAKLSFDLELTLYRILQEVCSNVVKHSKASALSIKIYSQDKNLYFTSSDNGIGLDMQELQWKGFGLQNMRRRIEDWKGKLEFESKPKKGFKINITIPNCI